VFPNAGTAEYAPFGKVDEAQFGRMFDGNVKGMLFNVQKVLPLIPNGGAIVLTASVVGRKGFQANTAYAATKAPVRSFAEPGQQA
jgi:NADP-dependent 3-hydroxy acid dehydrogenase YdfG